MMRLWRCLTALVLALLLTLSVGAAGTAGFFRRAGKPLGGAEHPALRRPDCCRESAEAGSASDGR